MIGSALNLPAKPNLKSDGGLGLVSTLPISRLLERLPYGSHFIAMAGACQ